MVKQLGDQARQDIAGRNTSVPRLNDLAARVPGQKGARIDLVGGGSIFDIDPLAGLPTRAFPESTPTRMEGATFPGTYGKDAA